MNHNKENVKNYIKEALKVIEEIDYDIGIKIRESELIQIANMLQKEYHKDIHEQDTSNWIDS